MPGHISDGGARNLLGVRASRKLAHRRLDRCSQDRLLVRWPHLHRRRYTSTRSALLVIIQVHFKGHPVFAKTWVDESLNMILTSSTLRVLWLQLRDAADDAMSTARQSAPETTQPRVSSTVTSPMTARWVHARSILPAAAPICSPSSSQCTIVTYLHNSGLISHSVFTLLIQWRHRMIIVTWSCVVCAQVGEDTLSAMVGMQADVESRDAITSQDGDDDDDDDSGSDVIHQSTVTLTLAAVFGLLLVTLF